MCAWFIFTARNEVGARFLHVCVILFTGGGLPQCMLGYHPPPGPGTPQEQTPRDQAPSPESGTPRAEHAGRYGQRVGGTHPTGMQSCYAENSLSILSRYQIETTSLIWLRPIRLSLLEGHGHILQCLE